MLLLRIDRDVFESPDGRYRVWIDTKVQNGITFWGAARCVRRTPDALPVLHVLGRQFSTRSDAADRCDQDDHALRGAHT